MRVLKFLAIAVCFAMYVSFIPAADIAAAAERVSFLNESVSDNTEVSDESETITTTKKTTTKKSTTTTKKTTTKKSTTTTKKTTTKKSTTTTKKTTTKKSTTTKKTTTSTTNPKTTVTTTVKTTATEAPYMIGDIDNDKKITGSDATRILREYTLISSGLEGELTQIQKDACDVDGDGKITGSDATLTLAYYTYQGSGGVLDFEDYMKYGPIDIQTTTTAPPTTQSTTTTTTTALDTGTTTGETSTETGTGTTTTTTAPPYSDPDTVQEIKLSHYEVTIFVGGGDMALVTMYPETAPDKSEKWWSSDTSVATVNYEGWITGISAGECTVTVQSVNNPDVTAEIKVTVIENKVTEIKLDKYEVRIAVGKGDMPLVTMYPETAPDKSERWWSSDNSIATVNEEGWIVGVAVGECTVTVRSVNNPDVTAEIKVIVTDEGLVKEIVLDRYEVELTVGKGDMTLVTMLPADAEDKSEIWWSSDASVATVNYEGWIVGTGVGECIVTVQSAANPTIKAEIKVIVK